MSTKKRASSPLEQKLLKKRRVTKVEDKEAPPKKTRVPTPKTVKYDQKIVKSTLKDNAVLEYTPSFLTEEEADTLYKHLLEKYTWVHGEYKMYGKTIPTPRLLSCVSDTDISKSYKVTPYEPFTEEVKKLKEKLEKHCGCEFTYAQMNYYRSGADYIGFHCDSEVYEGDQIAAISLGVTRRFVFRHKKWKENGEKKHEFALANGSLVIMAGDTQKHWKHCIPKEPKVQGGRISLTFRNK